MRKLQLVKEAAVAAAVIMFATFLISFLPFKFEFVKGIRQGLFGFDVYDLYYSREKKEQPEAIQSIDTINNKIVLVEIADSRDSIATQLLQICRYSPKVVGVDAVFEKKNGLLQDFRLTEVLSQYPNIVLANRNAKEGKEILVIPNVFDSAGRRSSGYIDFIGYEETVVIRTYYPFLTLDGRQSEAFSTAIARQYDPEKYKVLKNRNNEAEVIDYNGSLAQYPSLSREELAQYSGDGQLESMLKDKIVLLGYFVKRPPLVLLDLLFTPRNEKVVGKSNPDMYGVVIHANILSMILKERYVTFLSGFSSYVVSYILVFLLLLFVLYLHRKGHPNHVLLLLITLMAIALSFYLFLQLYALTLIKVDLVPLVIGIVFSTEALGIYTTVALWLHSNKRIRYTTIFSKKAHS